MRTNIPPIREQVFEAYIELPQKNGPAVRVPIIFTKTTRPWAEFFMNLSRQANTGAEAEISEDLFAAISPTSARLAASEQDLFGGASSAAQPLRDLSGFARYFLFMGA